MDWYSVINGACAQSGVSVSAIGPMMGKSRNYVANARSRGSVPLVTNAAAMLSACGYALVAIPASDVPTGALVIDAPPLPGDARKRALEREQAALARRLHRVQSELEGCSDAEKASR
jgi:hypothetical protein